MLLALNFFRLALRSTYWNFGGDQKKPVYVIDTSKFGDENKDSSLIKELAAKLRDKPFCNSFQRDRNGRRWINASYDQSISKYVPRQLFEGSNVTEMLSHVVMKKAQELEELHNHVQDKKEVED